MRSVYRSLFAGLLIIAFVAAACPLLASRAASAIAPATESQVSTQHDLYAVWGSSGSDVFAVGQGGTILHYDGVAWNSMNSSTTDDLYTVWGTSDDDVFAAGQHGTILHYDGVAWSPMLRGTTYDLSSIWGISNTDVYAAGQNGAIVTYNESLWDSTYNESLLGSPFSGMWTAMANSVNRMLYGVWDSSDEDVFAVGRAASSCTTTAVLRTIIPVPCGQ